MFDVITFTPQEFPDIFLVDFPPHTALAVNQG